ncbi:MAG TPA: undecaprenyl-diphosphate phosphatase [Actinomycetota bacterium]|nr:undecaprenyl-diphosphate phosphatase [Actinomycetota bacterium]
MSILEALVLGAVQGLTEFIPISSSGHLVIIPELFGWDHPGLAFDVMLHAASLLALLIYFSGDLLDMARGVVGGNRGSRRLASLLLIGTIPAGLAGLLFGDYFEEQFENASLAALQLLITAVILVGAEQVYRTHERKTASRGTKLRTMDDIDLLDTAIIGTAQAIAIFPGISRSGATIGAGLARSIERSSAARFAFLLAIPALVGATILKVPELKDTTLGIGPATAGFLSSLVTSYAAIWGLIRYLRSNTLYPFAVYCVVAGILFYAIL